MADGVADSGGLLDGVAEAELDGDAVADEVGGAETSANTVPSLPAQNTTPADDSTGDTSWDVPGVVNEAVTSPDDAANAYITPPLLATYNLPAESNTREPYTPVGTLYDHTSSPVC